MKGRIIPTSSSSSGRTWTPARFRLPTMGRWTRTAKASRSSARSRNSPPASPARPRSISSPGATSSYAMWWRWPESMAEAMRKKRRWRARAAWRRWRSTTCWVCGHLSRWSSSQPILIASPTRAPARPRCGVAGPHGAGDTARPGLKAAPQTEEPVTGSGRDDVFVADTRSGPFAPGATLDPSGSSEIEFQVDLGAGPDLLRVFGARGPDRFGGGGRDRLIGGSRGDTLVGGGGADVLAGRGGGDILVGRAGRDVLKRGGGGDLLIGGRGRDRMSGGPGHDQLRGGAGNDLLRGGPGHDEMNGGGRGGRGRDGRGDPRRAAIGGSWYRRRMPGVRSRRRRRPPPQLPAAGERSRGGPEG